MPAFTFFGLILHHFVMQDDFYTKNSVIDVFSAKSLYVFMKIDIMARKTCYNDHINDAFAPKFVLKYTKFTSKIKKYKYVSYNYNKSVQNYVYIVYNTTNQCKITSTLCTTQQISAKLCLHCVQHNKSVQNYVYSICNTTNYSKFAYTVTTMQTKHTTQNFLLHCVVNCCNANNFCKNNMLFILV